MGGVFVPTVCLLSFILIIALDKMMIKVINRDYYMAIFISYPILTLGLIWVSRVDMGYDMKIAIS